MPFTLTMPKLSPTMEEGTIVKWHKSENESIEAGDLLFEVATDKATVEYNALDSGYLRKILVPNGQQAQVNQPVAIFTESKDENIEDYKPTGILPTAKETITEKKETPPSPPRHAPSFVPEPLPQPIAIEQAGERIKASPLAKKLAKERGIDLSTVKGTGPGHRIVSKDLEGAQTSATFTHREPPRIAAGTFEEEVLTPIRKVIGKRLQESKSFIPHFYVQQTMDAAPLFALREQLAAHHIKLSFNDLIVKAAALALRSHPNVNSGYNSTNDKIILFKTIDISVAVSVNGGLITPIIRHTDYKNLIEISKEIKILAGKAKDNKLEPHEYKGGSFTISNLGMYGITQFQAIINPPQAAILAVGGIQDQAIIKNGVVVAGKVINLTLSADHRVVDGVAAAEFMRTLQKTVENPAILLL